MSPGELILVSVGDHVVEPPNEPVTMADALNQLAAALEG
jgi:hypothetical protein